MAGINFEITGTGSAGEYLVYVPQTYITASGQKVYYESGVVTVEFGGGVSPQIWNQTNGGTINGTAYDCTITGEAPNRTLTLQPTPTGKKDVAGGFVATEI